LYVLLAKRNWQTYSLTYQTESC